MLAWMLKISNHCHYHTRQARELVERVKHLPLDEFILHIEDSQIRLCTVIHQQKTCFAHALMAPRLRKRALQKNQALLRACNNKKKEIKTVIDLTAGWGKDSLVLATHGHSVLMVEQNAKSGLALSDLDYVLGLGRERLEGLANELLNDLKAAQLYLSGTTLDETETPADEMVETVKIPV